MPRFFVVLSVVFALVSTNVGVATAQQGGMDVSFSEVKLRELGFPEIQITVGPSGVDAPSELASGYYLVSLLAEVEYSAYVNFMKAPEGLSEDEATEQALLAAGQDLVQPGWEYAGGTNTFEVGVPVTFAIFLAPGEYQVAMSYYAMMQGAEEVMVLEPLVVTGEATPVASPVGGDMASPAPSAPVADVTLEMTDDLTYVMAPDPVP